MYPKKEILIFHVESSLHAGAGADIGHIDNPLQRERPTGIPIVQSNGVKGALREFFETTQKNPGDDKKIEAIFGSESGNDGSGAVAFGEARLLFFPVRSLVGIFAYITCPSVIARFQRDIIACGKSPIFIEKEDRSGSEIWDPIWVLGERYLAHTDSMVKLPHNGALVLEEMPFTYDGTRSIDECLKLLADYLFPNTEEYNHFKTNFSKRAIVLNDKDYIHFIKYSTEVEPHNRIDARGTVDPRTGVWYTEYLPSESILYSTLFIGRPRISNGAFSNEIEVRDFVSNVNDKRSWLGGDRTTGKGRVMMHLYEPSKYSLPAKKAAEGAGKPHEGI